MAARFSWQNSLLDDQLTNHCAKRAALLARIAAVSMGLLLPLALTEPLLMDSRRLRFLLFVPTDGENEGMDDWLDGMEVSERAPLRTGDGCDVTVVIELVDRLLG